MGETDLKHRRREKKNILFNLRTGRDYRPYVAGNGVRVTEPAMPVGVESLISTGSGGGGGRTAGILIVRKNSGMSGADRTVPNNSRRQGRSPREKERRAPVPLPRHHPRRISLRSSAHETSNLSSRKENSRSSCVSTVFFRAPGNEQTPTRERSQRRFDHGAGATISNWKFRKTQWKS